VKVIYFDCFAGVSGDMTLGALVDAGLPLLTLQRELGKLAVSGYSLTAKSEKRGAIVGTRVIVDVASDAAHRRHLADVIQLLSKSSLSIRVKQQAQAVFERLAEAEAQVHGIPAEAMHFHEVGAVDAMVDIVGACVGLEALGIERVFSSALPSGGGTVECAHGTLPVPAPATIALVAKAHAPLRPSPTVEAAQVELVTPTGAAILTTLATFEQPLMTMNRVGYGIGSRELTTLPNVLRIWVGEIPDPTAADAYLLLETNIDDMNPELFGYVLNLLLAKGARDVWFTPIQMKKNRPATMLSVIAPPSLESELATIILRETSTLGLRVQTMRRWEAGRVVQTFRSSLGEALVKLKVLEGIVVAVAPEYDSCVTIAQVKGMPLQEVFQLVAEEARGRFLNRRLGA